MKLPYTASGELDLSQIISRSSLPALPENLKPPFIYSERLNELYDSSGELDLDMVDETTGPFLAALLNVVYGSGS